MHVLLRHRGDVERRRERSTAVALRDDRVDDRGRHARERVGEQRDAPRAGRSASAAWPPTPSPPAACRRTPRRVARRRRRPTRTRRRTRPAASSCRSTSTAADIASKPPARVELLPGRQQPRAHRPARLPRGRRRPQRVDLVVERRQTRPSRARETPARRDQHRRPVGSRQRLVEQRRSIHARRSAAGRTRPDRSPHSRPSECANPPIGNRLSQGAAAAAGAGIASRLMRDAPAPSATGVNGCIARGERDARASRAPAPCPARPDRRSRRRSSSPADGSCRCDSANSAHSDGVRGSMTNTGFGALDHGRRRSRGSSRTKQSPPRSTVPRGSAVPNSTPPSDRRRPRACRRSSQPSVTVSRAIVARRRPSGRAPVAMARPRATTGSDSERRASTADAQNRKYRCASGSTSAGSQVSSSPSARTS